MKKMSPVLSMLVILSVLSACSFPTWLTYTNAAYGFLLKYPPGGSIVAGATDTSIRIQLPITPGTNLVEKYLEISVQDGVSTCESPLAAGYATGILTPTSMTINGLTWVREEASEGAAGSIFDWTAYSTVSGSVCVSLTFVLHSHNPGVYVTPPPTFNRSAESFVFILIVDTFKWLNGAAITPTPDLAMAVMSNTATPPPTPVSTSTPTPQSSDTPTSVSSGTPSTAGLAFTPKTTPPVFPYLRNCNPNDGQIHFAVMVSDPSMVHSVVLFLRLKNQSTGAETPWNQGLVMTPQGNGMYETDLSSDQIPNLSDISRLNVKAWLEYQFAATAGKGDVIGRSPVYNDVTLIPCK
jgi:hypothetical protein